jgi:pimeloyl-ACP methyl ester carboxylesterase
MVDEIFYGPLLDFFSRDSAKGGLGLEPDSEFLPFAYDWRLDNRENAKRLADRIEGVDSLHERDIGLVAHSMGGLVSRLMLLMYPAIAQRVRFFLQIASPLLGSAKAFYSLREGPSFGSKTDFVIKFNQHRDLQTKADLIGVLRDFSVDVPAAAAG